MGWRYWAGWRRWRIVVLRGVVQIKRFVLHEVTYIVVVCYGRVEVLEKDQLKCEGQSLIGRGLYLGYKHGLKAGNFLVYHQQLIWHGFGH